MHPHDLFLSSCIFFMIVILSGHVPTSLGADNSQYTNCNQSYQCANIQNISYPFWGGNRPEYCGHPSFGLNCLGEAPVITIQTRPYRVLSIGYPSQTLTVVREEFWSNTCPTNPNNASLDTIHFNYASDSQDLTLYYGCVALTSNLTLPNQFPCSTNRSTFGIYGGGQSNLGINVATCQTQVIVRVNQTVAASALQGNSVNITRVLNSGFGLDWRANDTECNRCVQSGGQCSYNSSSFVCYCSDQPYRSVCNVNTTGSNKGNRVMLKFGIGLSVGMLGITILLTILIYYVNKKKTILIYYIKRRRTSSMEDRNVEDFMRQYGSLAPKQYRYSDLSKITNSFKNKLGQGGYGAVYKGKLSDGRLVAVKVLSKTKGRKGEGEDFINEVASITRTSHVNVVALLGFCFEKNKRALVYEFVAKGSLDKFIYQNDDESSCLSTNCHLELQTLYQIAVGIARGLEYLHRGCSTRIVHFDIKPQNILLDEDFCPKISDFGLAKLCRKKQSHISMLGARGTVGYIAPEVFSRTFGDVSYKSDVYSYGMLVLEMVGVRNNIGEVQTSEVYFPHWIYEHLNRGKDLRLHGVTTGEDKETARKLILVGLWCIQTNPSDRPPMSKVLEMLEGNLLSLEIPPKPFLFSAEMPEMSAKDSSKLLSTVNMGVEMSEGYPQSSLIRSKNTLHFPHSPWSGLSARDSAKSI